MDYEKLFRRKIVGSEAPESTSGLKRVLGPFHLMMFGIGAIIGTGIFVLTGTAAAGDANRMGAGPAIILSFVISGVACGLAALCYAEFASMIPVAGSAYTYAYAAFGELIAWIIGWDLILEYAVGNMGIAIGWSGYFHHLLEYFNIHFPAWLTVDPVKVHQVVLDAAKVKHAYSDAEHALVAQALATAPRIGSLQIFVNLPAFLIVIIITGLLSIGVRESARANAILVFVKFAMIALFLWAGMPHVDFSKHWANFAPNGFEGIMRGASIIFFAYIGFDAISTAAEEARNPQRDLPIAIIGALAICTLLYLSVAVVLTSMVSLDALRNASPVAEALKAVGSTVTADIISLGAALSIAGVLLVMQYAQIRIFFAMSRDRLLPDAFARVNERTGVPQLATWLCGLLIAIPASLIDITMAADLCNIGTLFAFVLVAIGILVLRVKEPNRPRGFTTPAVWILAPLCVAACGSLMIFLDPLTWLRFAVWMAIGLIIYFAYGYRRTGVLNPTPSNHA